MKPIIFYYKSKIFDGCTISGFPVSPQSTAPDLNDKQFTCMPTNIFEQHMSKHSGQFDFSEVPVETFVINIEKRISESGWFNFLKKYVS